ncbi:MAG: T9SS C-terminal target domain-containing protein [Calditrichaeota bacterium]|nr:MAG: T9SS C-terminal target domain-containing protein [Calditrichota bacterium]
MKKMKKVATSILLLSSFSIVSAQTFVAMRVNIQGSANGNFPLESTITDITGTYESTTGGNPFQNLIKGPAVPNDSGFTYIESTGNLTYNLSNFGTGLIFSPAVFATTFQFDIEIDDQTLVNTNQSISTGQFTIPPTTTNGQPNPVLMGTLSYNDSSSFVPPDTAYSNDVNNFMIRFLSDDSLDLFNPILNPQLEVIGFDFELYASETSTYSGDVSGSTPTGTDASSGTSDVITFQSHVRAFPQGNVIDEDSLNILTDKAWISFGTAGDTLFLNTVHGSGMLAFEEPDTTNTDSAEYAYFATVYEIKGGTGIYQNAGGMAIANGLMSGPDATPDAPNKIDFFFSLLDKTPIIISPTSPQSKKYSNELTGTDVDSISSFPLRFEGIPSTSTILDPVNQNLIGFNVDYDAYETANFDASFTGGALNVNNTFGANQTGPNWQGSIVTFPMGTPLIFGDTLRFDGVHQLIFAPGDTLFLGGIDGSTFGFPTYEEYQDAEFYGGYAFVYDGTGYFENVQGVATSLTYVRNDSLVSNLVADWYFRLDIPTGTVGIIEGTPAEIYQYILSQNYPNPFNPTTTINYNIAKEGFASLKIFNILGQEVKSLVSKNIQAGSHSIVWNGTDNFNRKVSSGVYFYKLTSGDFTQTKKLLLLK